MSMPTVKELEIQLNDLVRNWESFGRQLPGIKESALDEIKYNKRHDDVKSQKAALYGKWLEVYPKASWDDVIATLNVVGENTIAKHVQEWLSSIERQMSLSPKQAQAAEVNIITKTFVINTNTPTQMGLSNEQSRQEVYNVPEGIVDKLRELYKSFVPLANQTKDEIKTSQVKVESLVSYVEEQRAFPIESNPLIPISNAEGFFQLIKPHYNFLNPYLLIALAIHFLTGDIVQSLQSYDDRVTTFSKATSVNSLIETLQQFRDHLRPSMDNKIIKIKFKNGFDYRLTIWVVEMLIQTLFPVMHHNELPWYEVGVGSLVLSFIASNQMILSLIVSCARKMEFMRHLGIISVTIGNILIRVDNKGTADDDSSSFEDTLIQATANDHIEAVRFLLKYTPVNVNVKGDHDWIYELPGAGYRAEDEIVAQLEHFNNILMIIKKEISDSALSVSLTNEQNPLRKFLSIENQLLNTAGLRKQSIHLPNAIKHKLIDICDSINSIKTTIKIGYLKKFLQSDPPAKYTTQVTITLNRVWSKCSVFNIDKLISLLFPLTPIEEFYWFRVNESRKALKIELLMKPEADSLFYFADFAAEVLGIIETRKNNKIIFESKENTDAYTFEKGKDGARIMNNIEIIQFLEVVIESPCLLDIKDVFQPDHNNNELCFPDHDATPLMIACCNSNARLVQLLLKHGADPNIKTESTTYTALLYSTNSSKIFQMLLDHGADAAIVNRRGETTLHRACKVNNLKVVEILLNNKYPHIDKKGVGGMTALFMTCSLGHVEIVNRLLQAKADPSIPDDVGSTPLLEASASGHLPVVERLLKSSQTEINICNAEGVTPLWAASCEGHAAVVKRLLTAQADPNSRAENGSTPLWIASFKGHKAVVKCLLRARVNFNIPNNEGITPLQIACRKGHDGVSKLFAKYCEKDEVLQLLFDLFDDLLKI